jgi:cyclophilin family peptidyl-prolyl cis-trans isomerase
MKFKKFKKYITIIFLSITLLMTGCAGQSSSTPAVSSAKPRTYSAPPAMQIDTSKNYVATIETSSGSFKIKLLATETPNTVNNFVFLSRDGYYNGIIFHRIIKTFMIQTGDPTGTGSGGPGYKFADELPPKHSYDPGIVAMANGGPNTNGSQFFICTGQDAISLNNYPNYTQFGQVIEGMDVVQKIASVDVVSTGREVSKPVNPPVIKNITITES